MDQAIQLITTLLESVPSSMRTQTGPTLLEQLTGQQLQRQIPPQLYQQSQSNLSFTQIQKDTPIPSVSAFNSQLNLGEKDQSLRKAANIFKDAAQSLETRRVKSESYWLDALKLRRGNWGLSPAPLPFGNANVKGADKLSKDVVVSFGLEGCELWFLALL